MFTEKHHNFRRGFTLMELIITISIIAIIAALAYPSYQDSVRKTRRAEAKTALYSIMQQQERFYMQRNTYSAFSSTTSNNPFKWWSGERAADSFYELKAEACTGKNLNECVLLTAIPGTENVMSSFTDPVCGNLTLNSANQKSYSISTDANSLCW
ncbi:type IV pilin protein [Solimicrobium silvestre]|nr:type IV pilin protein [Solimicrobium silvestre]